jgi:hypothetical protein
MTTPAAVQIAELLTALQLFLGLVIVLLAAYGYRRNASQPMFFLGTGIAMMTLVSTVTTAVSSVLFDVSFVASLSVAIEVIGMGLILYAVVLARRK